MNKSKKRTSGPGSQLQPDPGVQPQPASPTASALLPGVHSQSLWARRLSRPPVSAPERLRRRGQLQRRREGAGQRRAACLIVELEDTGNAVCHGRCHRHVRAHSTLYQRLCNIVAQVLETLLMALSAEPRPSDQLLGELLQRDHQRQLIEADLMKARPDQERGAQRAPQANSMTARSPIGASIRPSSSSGNCQPRDRQTLRAARRREAIPPARLHPRSRWSAALSDADLQRDQEERQDLIGVPSWSSPCCCCLADATVKPTASPTISNKAVPECSRRSGASCRPLRAGLRGRHHRQQDHLRRDRLDHHRHS